MMSIELPPLIDLESLGNKTIEELIEFVYENYFKTEFMDKEKRQKLFGEFIYLDLNFIQHKPERFWHLLSFNPSDEKYTVNPCVNATDLLICEGLKGSCNDIICIPDDNRLKYRCECIYRLRRLHWINYIIKLANNKDKNIKIWNKDSSDERNTPLRHLYIRYQKDLIDYLIVLRDGKLNGKTGYKFITAYPVVHNGTKASLNRSYKDFMIQKTKSRSQHY